MSIIRPPRPEDAPDLLSVHYRSWLATYPKYVEGVTEETIRHKFEKEDGGLKAREERWRSWITDPEPGKTVFVAEDGGKVAGFTITRVKPEDESSWIAAMYVDPDVLARGIGSQLMRAALTQLNAEQNDVRVEVAETNIPAVSFYKHHGFLFENNLPAYENSNIKMPQVELRRPAGRIN
ncbi:MAG TPA: GNAT family N-acetyltransferase [Candidatus Saccharimonadales bacterium]|nr:GNAT family N-acetyltransferase [Candidatus Saccharimonadales bacterium]